MAWTEAEYQAWQATRRTPTPAADYERNFQAQVLRLAKSSGWETYHTHDSRRSQPGFPDLVLAKSGRLIFAELKTATGKLTPQQATWLSLLMHTVPGVEVYEWRPADWATIVTILTRKEPRA